MGYCKLMLLFVITFILMCSGIYGHRFQRHLKHVSPTPADVENVELNNFNLNNELASDRLNGVQDGENVTLVGPGEIELELSPGHNLEFKICAKNCMNQIVVVCYDAEEYNSDAKGEKCSGSNQCEFRAGVEEKRGSKRIWAMKDSTFKTFTDDDNTCGSSVMRFSWTNFLGLNIESCLPVKRDGNVVKLYVQDATKYCPLYVVGAKIWYPPTPPPTPTPELPTEKPAPSKPPPSSSSADSSNTLWIVIAVVSGILGIALLIGLGCLIYHCCIKKKSTTAAPKVDGKKNQISTETKTITEVQTPTVKQETEKEKEKAVEEKVTTTKEETEEPKPKKKTPKQKSKKQKKKEKESKKEKKAAPIPAPKAPTPNRTKPTQEETPPNATGPTFEETTAASIVSQKPTAPTLRVLNKIIVPERPYATSNKSYSKSRKTDSLSGHHDLNMQMIVEDPAQALARFYDDSNSCHQSSKDKKAYELKIRQMKDIYPGGERARPSKDGEVRILCCKISAMFKEVEVMRTTAEKKLEEHGAKFDQNGCIMKMPPGTLYYVQNRSTAEYIRAFAFGALFHEEIDGYTASQTVMSIPLLFVISLQRRYSVRERRQACAWIRRQMPVILHKYTMMERGRLAYPICRIESAYDKDHLGFDDPDLHTESKDEVKKQQPPPRAHHQNRGHRSKGKKEKLVEYNQKSKMDAPNMADDSKNELQKQQPPPSRASSRKSRSRSRKALKGKLVEYNQKSIMDKM